MEFDVKWLECDLTCLECEGEWLECNVKWLEFGFELTTDLPTAGRDTKGTEESEVVTVLKSCKGDMLVARGESPGIEMNTPSLVYGTRGAEHF